MGQKNPWPTAGPPRVPTADPDGAMLLPQAKRRTADVHGTGRYVAGGQGGRGPEGRGAKARLCGFPSGAGLGGGTRVAKRLGSKGVGLGGPAATASEAGGFSPANTGSGRTQTRPGPHGSRRAGDPRQTAGLPKFPRKVKSRGSFSIGLSGRGPAKKNPRPLWLGLPAGFHGSDEPQGGRGISTGPYGGVGGAAGGKAIQGGSEGQALSWGTDLDGFVPKPGRKGPQSGDGGFGGQRGWGSGDPGC